MNTSTPDSFRHANDPVADTQRDGRRKALSPTSSPARDTATLAGKVTVVIVSRNRAALLQKTLQTLRASLPCALPTYVVDDASDRPLSLENHDGLTTLSRNRHRRGLVASRNDANFAIATPYVLSLDDDSWPVAGKLDAAVAFLDSEPEALALAFPIRRPHGKWQVPSVAARPYPVKAFVGCAHLMDARHFRALGGYSAEIIHQGEELDLAARGRARGLRCIHFPGFVVHHEHTNVARDVDRMLFHGGRNKVRLIRTFCPENRIAWLTTRALVEMAIFAVQHRRTSPLRGWWRGLREPVSSGPEVRFTPASWREWRSLPYS